MKSVELARLGHLIGTPKQLISTTTTFNMALKPTIVIIGESYAGIGVAQALLKAIPNVKIVMINPSD